MPAYVLQEQRGPSSAEGSFTSLTEGVSFELKPAPLGKRFVAFAIDVGIISAVSYLVFFGSLFLFAGLGGAMAGLAKGMKASEIGNRFGAGGLVGLVLLALLFLVVLLALLALFDCYFIYFEYKKGSTPGKSIFGLKVVSLKNSRLTLGQCCLREVLRHVDVLLVLPGLISLISTKRRQRLGDLAASTLVVHSSEKEESEKSLYVTREDYQWFTDACRPKPVPLATAKKYLTVAYPHFILRRRAAAEDALESWADQARNFIEIPDPALDRDALLLYFAEHCLRTLNQKS